MRTIAHTHQPVQAASAAHSTLARTLGKQAERGSRQAQATELELSAEQPGGHDFSRLPIYALPPVRLQAKLTVNTPGDSYEQEADRIADQVLHTTAPPLQPPCACGGGCKNCQAKQPNQEHFSLQTKRLQAGDTGQITAPPIVHEVLAGPGQPLDSSTRAFMEPRFGYDFSRVRIHSDTRAAASAQSLNALAYTSGTDVVFAAGQFAPATAQGRKLLAHELAHVMQQSQYASSVSRAPSGLVQRKQAPVQPASEPCNPDQLKAIKEAAQKADKWLKSVIPALDAFLSGKKTDWAQAAAAALNKHFHSTEPAVVTYIRNRLETIQNDLFGRPKLRYNCLPAGKGQCGSTDGSQQLAAYVEPQIDKNVINICTAFFDQKTKEERASTLIHEFGHAQLGLSEKRQIDDREYGFRAYYAYLTTGEALTNADSYAMLAREVATGFSPAKALIMDNLRECPNAWVPLVRDALSKARDWNHKAALHTTAKHQFSKAYKVLDRQLESADSYKCIPDGSGRCSDRVVAYWYAAGDLRICPSLIRLPTPDARALSLLAALYAYKGLVDGADERHAAAREARRLHTANVPTSAEVLTGA